MDILKLYLNELKPFVATQEENTELISKWKAGDMRAYDRLVKNFLPLVIKIAKKYISSSSSLEDLICSGNEYLLMGINKFEESKGALAPYLAMWIEAGIVRFIKGDNGAVHIPENVMNMKTFSANYFYLDQVNEDSKFELEDKIDEETYYPKVIEFLSSLCDRDKAIIELAFGINSTHCHTSKEISEITGYTVARINQIFKKITGTDIRKVSGNFKNNFK